MTKEKKLFLKIEWQKLQVWKFRFEAHLITAAVAWDYRYKHEVHTLWGCKLRTSQDRRGILEIGHFN